MKSRKKIDALIRRQIARYNQEHLGNKDFQKKQLEKRRRQFKNLSFTRQEKQIWERFREIVQKKRQEAQLKDVNSKVHFDFQHVDELGVPWDLLIIMGEKNIGKTYAQSQLIRREIEKDPDTKFFLIRTTRKELEKGLRNQLDRDEHWPVTIGQISTNPSLVWKATEPKPPKYLKLKTFYVGWCTHVNGNGLSSSQGSSYKNLRYAIWDEFNDDGNLKGSYKQALLRFFMSIQRNNEDFKLILCGNLLGDDNKPIAHVLLDELNIPFDAKVKYRVTKHWDNTAKKQVEFKVLYLNIGGTDELYDGVRSQTFTYMFGEEAAQDLLTNLPAYRTSKVVNKISFLKGTPWFSWVVSYEHVPYCIYIAQVRIDWNELNKGYYYVMHIDFYTKDNTELGYSPICDDITLTNLFGMLLKSWSEVVAHKFHTLQHIIEQGLLYFSNDPTRELFNNKIYPKLVKKYNEFLKDWF